MAGLGGLFWGDSGGGVVGFSASFITTFNTSPMLWMLFFMHLPTSPMLFSMAPAISPFVMPLSCAGSLAGVGGGRIRGAAGLLACLGGGFLGRKLAAVSLPLY